MSTQRQVNVQVVQLLQRDRATLRVIEYFAKSLKGDSRSYEMTLLSRACVTPVTQSNLDLEI